MRYENGSKRDGTWKEGKLNGFVFYHISDDSSPTLKDGSTEYNLRKSLPTTLRPKKRNDDNTFRANYDLF